MSRRSERKSADSLVRAEGVFTGFEKEVRSAEHLDRRRGCEHETRTGERVAASGADQLPPQDVRDAPSRHQHRTAATLEPASEPPPPPSHGRSTRSL